jgi:LPXTG-site transpeptidase (sortase) family protein
VPSTTSVAGWYTGSPRPGETGAAVIAGHIDSYAGPGVFYRLKDLKPGDLLYVRRGHGTLAVFKVTAVRMFPKARFPTAAVYGPVPDAQLRLITCGGTFDPTTGHYLSNVIVFASLQPALHPQGIPRRQGDRARSLCRSPCSSPPGSRPGRTGQIRQGVEDLKRFSVVPVLNPRTNALACCV